MALQRNIYGDDTHNLLIDFDSPLQGRLNKTLFTEPLVPSPRPGIVNISDQCSADNNPFDFLDHQTNLNVRMLNDPFELVYYETGCKDLHNTSSEDMVNENSKENDVGNSELIKENNLQIGSTVAAEFCDRNENSFILIEDVTDPFVDTCVSFSDISPVKKVPSQTGREIKHIEEQNNLYAHDTRTEAEENITEALDDSVEAIKAIVANRVNVCIQNALNQSRLNCENLISNHDSSFEHVFPVRHNTSWQHSFSQNSRRNVSLTDITSTCLNTAQSVHPVSENSIFRANWSKPQRSSSFSGGLNKSFFSPPRYLKPEYTNVSVCETLKIKPDLLECIENMELKNRRYFGASWRSDSDHKQMENKLKKFQEKYKAQTELIPVKIERCRSDEKLTDELAKNVSNICSSDILETEDSPDFPFKTETDSVFLEANNVAFMFRSFTQIPSDGEEEDILTCKPQWENSDLKLPKFNSEEDDNEDCKLATFSVGETRKTGILKNTKGNKVTVKQDKDPITSPDIMLAVILPVMEKTDGNIRIKPKQMQPTRRKGPIRAVMPLGNMVRTAGIINNVSPPDGNKDNVDLGSSSHVVTEPTIPSVQPEVSRSGKSMEVKCSMIIKEGLTSADAQCYDPSLRCASPAGGIPLVSPAVSLKNKESHLGKNMTPVQMSSKLSQLNLSGLVATSTPTRNISFSSGRTLMKIMPSPILDKGNENKSPPVEIPKLKKPLAALKNRSFDGNQEEVKTKGLSNKLHKRSKSESGATPKVMQPQKETLRQNRNSYNSAKKIPVPSDKFPKLYSHIKNQPEVRDVQGRILKPLKLNRQSVPGRQTVKMNDGSAQKKRLGFQLLSKFKKNSLLEVDKENVKPV